MGKSTCLDSFQWLPSVTLFSDLVLNRLSILLQLVEFHGLVIILLKIYKHAFLLIKYPCSTRDLGPPCPSFCLWLVLQSVEAYRAHFLARAFKTSLRGRPVPSWAVQVLCMGFIGFPHNPRDIALSLSFIDSSPQVPFCKRLQHSAVGLGVVRFYKKIFFFILITGLWYLIVVLFWLMMGRNFSRAYLPLTSLLWWSTC